MRRLLLVLTLFSFAVALKAQETPKYELFGGYSLLHNDAVNANGWEASGAYNLNRWIGVKADVSGHYRGESNPFLTFSDKIHFLTIGPVFSWRTKRATLFGHTLFGYARQDIHERVFFPLPPGFPNPSDNRGNSFGTVIGGGGDWNFGNRFAWRVGQLDYMQHS